MSKIQRKGSFESAGLKKTKLKNAKEERVDLLFSGSLEDAISSVRSWIGEFTGNRKNDLSFSEFIEDGVVLCELVQSISPGVIKKISKVKSRFAYWENFTFFLKACKSLGLQEWQLFDPEELLGQRSSSPVSCERRVKNIVAILYWLARRLEASPYYSGPKLDSKYFSNSLSPKTSNCPSIDNSSLSSTPVSTPSHTPEHKVIPVSSPNVDQQKPSPPLSPTLGSASPLLWVEKVRGKDLSSQESYCFAQPDASSDDPCYRIPSQHSVLSSTDSTGETQDLQPKKRRERLSARVEAYNPPSAFNVDLVFVHGSTSSSVFSPTAENQVTSSEAPRFSLNQLSNTFGAPEPIDSTGLIIDPLEFHSEVFTAGTDSQESGPHFSSPRSESTFHVNLTQTSQPDILSISNTQLDDLTGIPSQPELPSISEVVKNSSPIDTFDLHHTKQVLGSNQTLTNHSNIEYSHSQEYNDRQIHHIENHSPPYTNNQVPERIYNKTSKQRGSPNRQRDSPLTSSKNDTSPNTSSSSSSNASLIVVGYSPRSNSNSTSPLTKRESYHPLTDTIYEKKPPYRRYSSPQQRPFGYKSARAQILLSENNSRLSESGSESENEMSLSKANRSSGKKQMKVVPAKILPDATGKDDSARNGSMSNGVFTIDVHATFLPGEKQHGMILGDNHGHSYPTVCSVTGDTPAFRCGVRPGDELIKLNGELLHNMNNEETYSLLAKAIVQRELSLCIQRDTSNKRRPPQPLLPVSTTMTPNGVENQYQLANHTSQTKIPPRIERLLSLDLQRVQSDALPKHQVASKISADHERLQARLLKKESQENLEMEVLSDINSTAVEIGSSLDTDSHHTISSMGNDGENRSELNRSPSLPSVDEVQEPQERSDQRNAYTYEIVQSNSPQQLSPGFSPSFPDDSWKSEEGFVCSPGKSQSVTELSTISPLPPTIHSRDRSDTGITDYYRSHQKAKKAESLPVKLRTISPLVKDGPSDRSNSTTPGMRLGLNLQNMSIEDMHSASKLQIDQIWKEVESCSSLVSPVEDEMEERNRHHLHMDTIYTQTPEEWSEYPNGAMSPKEQEPMRYSSSFETSNTFDSQDKEKKSQSPVAPLVRRSSSTTNEKKGIESLLTTLRSLNEKVGTYDEEEEFKLLESILQSSKFKKAKELHDNMRGLVLGNSDVPAPVVRRVVPATQYIRHFLREEIPRPSSETEELRRLLRKPDVQAAIFCHDKVATHDLYVPSTFFPRSAQDQEDIILTHSAIDLPTASLYTSKEAPLSRDIPSNRKEIATIVYLHRTNRPLGCAIYKHGNSVFVSKILEGCDAEQSGAIKEGDELLEVNGIALVGKSNDEIIRLMSGEAGKVVAFTLIPVHDDTADLDYEEKYVRAHFNYNGDLDDEIPCKELALSFSRGDILEISNQDNPDWWQARKVFEDGGESLPGLIPARHLQQKREVLRESYAVSMAHEEKSRRRSLLSKITRKNKKKKIYYNQGPLSGAFHSVGHEVATYEDVVKLLPNTSRRRPILLIGPPSVGRRTLVKHLIESSPRHFSTCISHTSRPPRPGEVNGREFHFVSREEMERGIQNGKFLDYAETRGHLHGVSVASVKDVINKGKIPVLNSLPQALKVVGSSGLIPYIIMIAASRVERLQITRKVTSEKTRRKLQASMSADFLDRDVRSFTESELLQMYHASQEIQTEYSHYFDWIIVNDDLQIASDLLLEVARRIEEEPQWVPASWVEEV